MSAMMEKDSISKPTAFVFIVVFRAGEFVIAF